MSIVAMILGESGAGKTTSLRNLDPTKTLLIQAVRKPLPFRAAGWSTYNKATKAGSIIVTDHAPFIVGAMKSIERPIVVIDDFQYILANEFMRRVTDKEVGNAAFQKYNEIARSAWDILMAASSLADDRRVYVLSHTTTDESGHTKVKTIGKLLDEKIVLEGLVTIVLRTSVRDGRFVFQTQNDGNDTTKSPLEMFDERFIDNDLKAVDDAICSYYSPTPTNHLKAA